MAQHPATDGQATSPGAVGRRSSTRRAVFGGVLGLGVALPVLAACGSEESGGSGGSGGEAPAGGLSAPTGEIPVGGGTVFDEEEVVITQPAEGDFRAFGAICPHQGCVVSEVTEEGIACTCHGSSFSLEDGSVLDGPAEEGLPALRASVEGSEVTVS